MPQVPRAALLCTTTRWVRVWEKIQQHRKEFRNEWMSLKIWVQSLTHELKCGQPLQKNMWNSHSMLAKGGKSIRAGTTCLGLEHSGYQFRFFVAWTISSQLTLQQSSIAMKDEPSEGVLPTEKRTVHCYLMDACELISGPAEPVFVRGAQYQHTCSMNRHKIENDRNQCFVERFSFRSLPGVCCKTRAYFPFVPQVIDRSQQKVTRTKAGHNNQTPRNGKSEHTPPQKKICKTNMESNKKWGLKNWYQLGSTEFNNLGSVTWKNSVTGSINLQLVDSMVLTSLPVLENHPSQKQGQFHLGWIPSSEQNRGMEHSRRPSRLGMVFLGSLGMMMMMNLQSLEEKHQLRVGYDMTCFR